MNIGSDHGVELDMLFDILTPKGYDIKDPDTGEILGSVERAKARVKIVTVREKLSIASTYRTQQVNVGGVGFSLGRSGLFEPPKWVTQVETLKTDEHTLEELPEEESYVSTGDPVIQVIEDDTLSD